MQNCVGWNSDGRECSATVCEFIDIYSLSYIPAIPVACFAGINNLQLIITNMNIFNT